MMRSDTWLDGTDVIITSHVLSDPNSKFFLTYDTKLLENPRIIEYEKKMRDDGLRDTKLKITTQI